MPQFILERTASGPLTTAMASAQQATTFGQLIAALKSLGEALGDTETAASLQGQMQYGLRKRGQKARKELNAKAREILARVNGDPDALTNEDRDVLSQYSGRGGIQDDNSLSEYYTPQPIAEGVWDMLAANGFENGNVLEPSTGAGVFLATKPAGVKVSGAEIDETSSGVTALLHPDDDVANQSFEQLCATAEDNSFDSVIGNVPFGDARGKWAKFDPEYQDIKEMERYFITRAIDKVRHGGLVALIVPPNIVSKRSKTFINWRRDISRKAEFLGAHKLPSGTFGGANGNGTDTVVDVLIMRKHSRDLTDKVPDLATDTLTSSNVYWDQFISGRWFERDGKRFVHGEIVEGFRTEVQSEIDNAGLKRLMARKFSSRIDFAALDTAETITRNYQDGDRRVIGMQMHEFAGGEWIKVTASDGIDASTGRIDAERYGVDNATELRGILGGSPAGALEISFENARNAVHGPFNNSATDAIKSATYVGVQAEDGMRERLYRAALIGNEISRYGRDLTETGQADEAKRERLQRLVTAEVEKYGNPANDPAMRQVSGPGANDVGAFVRAMRKDGGFSDLLSGKRTGERGQAVDTSDPADVLRHLASTGGNGPIALEDVQAFYSGEDRLTLEALAARDGIAITADGLLQPMEHFASGNVVDKIAALQRAMTGDVPPVLVDKYQTQLDAINARRRFTDVDDITFGLKDKWFDRNLVEQFMQERGYDFVAFDQRKGEFTETLGHGAQRFEKQLLNYLNGQTVRSKNAEAAAEYKQQIRDLEEEFGVWMRQHDDIDSLVAQYNDAFNDHVPVEYDGSDLALDNVADWITPHDFQAAAVRRLSDEGRGILALDVGLGKTLSALSLVQYNTQKGRAKRSCIVVPKAVLENWYHEARQFHKSMDHVHFVGFTPKMKGGEIEREPVLDEEGSPKVGRNGEVQYRDVLVEDNADTMFDKMNDIPQTSKTLVVMSRERFGMIPLRPETREQYADEMVSRNLLRDSEAASLAQGEEVRLGRGGDYDEAKKSERYQQKYNDDGTRKKGEYPFYEDMGFDSVTVDEGHEYKNTYQASGDTQRLAYLPTPQPSKRSVDMAVKMDHLRSRNQGAGPVMLTATPVTNSPVEIYNMLSHIVPAEQFERMGISNVDDFVQTFCHITEVQRTKLSGEVVTEEGVAGFQNLDGLRSIFHRYTNMKSAQDVNDDANSLKIPDSTEVHAAVDMTDEQARVYEELRQEADQINQEVMKQNEDGETTTEEARPVFAIIRDMDRITTDLDLYLHTMSFTIPASHADDVNKLVADLPDRINRKLRDEETGEMENVPVALDDHLSINNDGETLTLVVHELYEADVVKRLKKFGIDEKDVAHPVMPKYAKLLENLRREHENGGKQIIFTEEKSQHDKLRRIITHHLPIEAKEIGIINADTASGDKLEKISGDYNTGKSRIIIANKKAEVGVNLQKGTTAIHHLTLPWTPASIQQRNGRGVRQGNTAPNVDVIYYMGKGSFDGYRLDILKNKADWIKDLFFGDSASAENANAGSDEEMAVMLAADPEEQRRRIAEMRQRKEQETRERANKRAAIDLSNLQKHRAFLAGYEQSEQRAADNAEDRGRDPENARERMRAKRDKAMAQVKQIEGRLINDQEKGRIDHDAKRLVSGGHYLTTLDGGVIEPGQVYEHKRQGALLRVESIQMDSNSLTMTPLIKPRAGMARPFTVAASKMGGYQKVDMSPEKIDEYVLTKGAWKYAELGAMSVDDAFLRDNAERLLPNHGYGRLIMVDTEGELTVMDTRSALEAAKAGFGIAKPKPGNASWHERAMAALFASRRDTPPHEHASLDTLGESLFGKTWLSEATQSFGNPASEATITEAVSEEIDRQWQAYRAEIPEKMANVNAAIDEGREVSDFGIRQSSRALSNYASTFTMTARVRGRVTNSLEEAGYDVDGAKIKDITQTQVVDQLVGRVEADIDALVERLKAQRDAKQDEARANALERAEEATDALPDSVTAFFEELGLHVKINTEALTWQHKGGGRRRSRSPRYTSQAGERFMLFDPKGRGGPLATALAGNKTLQSEYNAVWTIFDGDLWWHFPTDGIDYEQLMEAFR